jgi:hypothetical protein
VRTERAEASPLYPSLHLGADTAPWRGGARCSPFAAPSALLTD